MAAFSSSDDLRGAEFRDVDMRGARFLEVDLRDAVVRGADVANMSIDGPWLFKEDGSLIVNGVEVVGFVDDQLNQRFPGREQRNAEDPDGLRSAWEAVERTWADTLARAATMPEGSVDVSIDDEWSFAQTLRHLVQATDIWLGRAILETDQPSDPIGLSYATSAAADREAPTPPPTYDEILSARADRHARVRTFIAGASAEDLAATRPNPHNADRQTTVLACLHVILLEEWEHLRFAVRDLDAIAPGAAS